MVTLFERIDRHACHLLFVFLAGVGDAGIETCAEVLQGIHQALCAFGVESIVSLIPVQFLHKPLRVLF